jgi:PAS domain S-box-containing protein
MNQARIDVKSPGSPRRKSIARQLTLSLVLTVVAVSLVLFLLLYTVGSQKATAQLQEKADEYAVSLAGVLENPLWNLDDQLVIRTGEAYAHNELFERLLITGEAGRVYYDYSRLSNAPRISRATVVYHKGKPVGRIEFSITAKQAIEADKRFLWFGLGMLLVVIFVLVLATGFLLRIHLNKPLEHLGSIANTYAAGTYNASEDDMPFLEFRPFVDVLSKMGDTITGQIKELRIAEEQYRSIFEGAVEGIFQVSPDETLLKANPSFVRILGYEPLPQPDAYPADIFRKSFVDPRQRQLFRGLMTNGTKVSGFHVQLYRKDGSVIWASLYARPVLNEDGNLQRIEGILHDITERKKAEQERVRLEQQLVQAQKMESIGRLAGGVAHDFNNMLTVILGYAELLRLTLPEDSPFLKNIVEIERAAGRSRDITRQLLAFSRKQVIAPKSTNLNKLIISIQQTLVRLIGEDIELRFLPEEKLWNVKIDSAQFDQILVNLAANARDAMPDGGKLTIASKNVTLDEAYCGKNTGYTPGQYVLMEVSDNGTGMDSATLEHLFEPFFTTKEVDKGTGLGLATVYGIVKQNAGFINVYSEPGEGTTFRIYIPRDVSTEKDERKTPEAPLLTGSGTILLVEDDKMVRELTRTMLAELGYTVLTADTPQAALTLSKEKSNAIDLLITDVVMPGMKGPELRERIADMHPGIKVLFMSGYAENIIIHHGVLEQGVEFLQKPFTIQDLARKVHAVLEGT